MSLLMDALKRAEKARQAQAEKQADGKSTSKLALDPIEDEPQRSESATPEPPPAPEGNPPPEDTLPPAKDQATTHFSLTDDYPVTERMRPSSPPGSQDEEEKLGPFSLARDNELSLEDTGEMLPVVREAETSLNEYFDDPDSSLPTSSTRDAGAGDDEPTKPGARAAREGDRSAKRAAESVFKAKAPAIARYQRNRTLMIALPLLLLGVIGIGVLLFWDSLERTFFGTPQLLPPRPPPTAEVPPATAAAAQTEALASSTAAISPGQPVAAVARSAETASTSSTASANPAPATGSATGSRPTPADAVGATAKAGAPAATTGAVQGTVTGSSAAAPPRQQPAVTKPPAALTRPYTEASAGGIRISRRSNPDRMHAGISEAYEAFQRGDDATALRLYSEVYRQHPNNRNALLGLGALAVRGGNFGQAVGHYAHLLSINPRDPIARAALINLNQRVPAGEGESHVKRLLSEDSEQPFLYFTLGNLYARQGRWLEAQQAYFEAYRRESNSADFSFNLAVSLDQLGQPAAALTYYHRALALASTGGASFEPGSARMRIERLSGGGEG